MAARSRNRNSAARPLPGVLGAQLRRLAGWAVASSLGAAIGCSGSQAEPAQLDDAGRDSAAGDDVAGASGRDAGAPAPARESDWTTMPCDTLLLVTHPVRPALALDYFGVVGPMYRGASVILSDYGNPCQGASDAAACIAKLNEFIRGQAACEPGPPCPSITVSTRGDLVERQTTPKQLHAVLGEIDTKSEAAVVAMVQGIMLTCRAASLDESLGTRVRATESGYRVESQWNKCSSTIGEQAVDVRRDGTASALENTLFSWSNCTIGRRPDGLELARVPQSWEPLGKFLAEVAQLEAASVFAFERLAFELQQLGAPAALSAAARESADDERRHALLMAALAHDYGGALFAPKLPASGAPRNALALALENAVEGCVRETFGAIIAWHQACLARDERVAAVMRGIAADETGHAELSWRIAAWLEPQLNDQDRGLVGAARDAALRELERELAMDALPDSARALIGLPSTSVQRSLLDRMASQLTLS